MNDISIVDDVEAAVRAALSDDYRLEGLLGRGGMSMVFLAREISLNRPVAIKVLPLKLAREKSSAERFQQEATIAASLDHPHVAPVHRIGRTNEFLWYTMKYIRGQSLEETLGELRRIDLHSCLSLVEQTASALDYAHKRGIIHRDVKPANVLLDENAWVYVCDFGVAKAVDAVKLTQTGGTLGTPAYMSPEQLYGRRLDGRSDQYSLAVMTFELLTGRRPFVAESVGELVRMHCSEPPPLVSEFRPDLPERVAEGVHRAMSKDPADRFDGVIDYLVYIGGRRPPRAVKPRVSTEIMEATTTPLPGTTTAPASRRRTGHLSVGIAAAALVTLAVGFWPANSSSAVPGAREPAATQEAGDPEGAVVRGAGHLYVSTLPWGQLFIDGERVGNTPALDLPLSAGVHRVRVVRDGYRVYEREIDVLSGREVRLTGITLERIEQ